MKKRYLLITFLSIITGMAFSQTGKLKGKVTDSTGAGVQSATVQIEKTQLLTLTDDKGNYSIDNIPVGSYTILVQLVGAAGTEQKAEIKDKETTELYIKLKEKVIQLNKVDIIRPFVSGQGMGHMPETYEGVDYAGMKTEVLVLDSVNANKAQDNFRETLGRLPGSNYSETEGGGFPSNGIAFRGLIPTQSIEIQTRQNGYNLSGDVYGYPESYYLPPLIAVSQIQVIRGEASLQYGPQFGGIINYVIKDGSLSKPWEFGVEETTGSYDFVSNVLTGGGTYKKWRYFTFVQYKATDGWRPNSDVKQATAFAKVEYNASDNLKIGLEYTLLRNLIHMPGGLTDAEFDQNADQSFRTRNWLSSPWNLLALTATYKVNDNTSFVFKSVLNNSARNLVWKNEDGGPQQADTITPSGTYVPREVERESFLSLTNELRFLTTWNLGNVKSTLAAGVRYFQGGMWREEQGPGSTGTNFDLNLYGGTWGDSSYFTTVNIAPFVENTFHFGNFSVTPGFRYEYIRSTASGNITVPGSNPLVQDSEHYALAKTWYIPLAGCALQLKTGQFTNMYGNIVQAYEPTTYENLTPIGTTAVIDPNLKDVNGFNSDLGWRGKAGRFINFDIGVFYLAFDQEIGFETVPNVGVGTHEYETNVGDAVHKGVETYVEIHMFKLLNADPKIGDLSFFNSYAYDQSRYVSGPYVGDYEEMAPVNIERIGVNYTIKKVSTTFLYSYTSKSYADANNTIYDPTDAEVGLIPAYHVVDWSSSYKVKNYAIQFGISNLLNAKYFNLRTNEYPGPGIIPAPGTNFYIGLSAQF